MIRATIPMQIFVCTQPTDMRRSFDGLSGMVRQVLSQDPLSGALFLFRNRASDRLKILYWDRDGLAIWYKCLEKSGFLMPDCWSGFKQIHLRSDLRITRVACIPHPRRHVHECRASHPQQARVLLAMFRQLYDIEDRAKELSTDGRLALRQTESVPVLNRMQTYLDSGAVSLPHVLPKSDFAQAMN